MLLSFFKKHSKTGAVMLVDFTKAFDVLNIQFLNLCLEKFNFGESFRKWIAVLYTDISSSVLVNGWISKCFNVERGIRQGCPLSALLFIIAAEFLAISVRENKNVKPVEIIEHDFQLKLLQYADDTLFFVQDENSVKEILNELNKFGKIAGPKINKEKTALIWLGDTSKKYDIKKYDLIWADKPVKYLGHYIHSVNDEALNLEWEEKLVKLQKTLDSWSKRNLTIFGRVTVLKCLALSQIIHLSIVDSIPTKFMKSLNTIVFRFIWNKKVEKIKRCTLTESYKNGGIRMTDIHNQMLSFRLKWLGRFLNDNKETWKKMFSYWFDLLGGTTFLLNCNFSFNTLNIVNERKIPTFYKEILEAWELIRTFTTVKDVCMFNPDYNDIRNQIIWHNKHILFNNQSLFYKDWYKSGITYLTDIVGRNGFHSMENIRTKINIKRSKNIVMFDYTRLKKAIPTVWIRKLSDGSVSNTSQQGFIVPKLLIGNTLKCISDLSSNVMYKLFPSRNIFTNKCCLYWENKLNTDINWQHVFHFNLEQVREYKLREFNLKLLYNLLPVRSNLFKWNITRDDLCPKCNVKEDIVHAFIECDLNKPFFMYIENILREVYKVKKKITIMHLLKIEHNSQTNLLLTIAFWSMYKIILERNKTGKEKRNVVLKYVFAREIRKRIEVRRNDRIKTKREDDLPKELLRFI